jgi:hypothetical protein
MPIPGGKASVSHRPDADRKTEQLHPVYRFHTTVLEDVLPSLAVYSYMDMCY